MGVFLRWGIFGIIGVAALVYAYNAIGHLADRRGVPPAGVIAPPRHASQDAPAARATADVPRDGEDPAARAREVGEAIPEHCAIELDIARRAAESRSIGEPLDRVLRIQEIAWEKDAELRARYARLATRWYNEPGPPDAARLRREVVAGCVEARR